MSAAFIALTDYVVRVSFVFQSPISEELTLPFSAEQKEQGQRLVEWA